MLLSILSISFQAAICLYLLPAPLPRCLFQTCQPALIHLKLVHYLLLEFHTKYTDETKTEGTERIQHG